ncbi:glutamate receptor U1-like [Saccostrea echinata]|uniref:glutamate receptor U1-like n=1 Tax=Saccostrea echinata TaxID=191078 RepID=UPI002A81C6BA|nr:glutamate receptor U1-like [Saccostrea echinata]
MSIVASVPCDGGIMEWNTPPSLIPLLFPTQELCHYVQVQGGSWMHSDCRVTNELLHSIAKQKMWKQVYILYDDTLSLYCLQDLIVRLSFDSVTSQLIHVATDESVRSVVRHISYTRNIFYVVAEEYTISSLLQEANPYIKKSIDAESGKVVYSGFCYDILEDLAKALNFRYLIKDSVDGLYGNPTDDFSDATGMIGMVMRKEADIAVGPVTRTADRLKVVDFLAPFQEEGIGFLMRKIDSPPLEQMFHVFRPFSLVCWVAVVVSIVVTGIILSIIAKLSPYAEHKEASLSRNLWVALSSILGQEDGPRPRFLQGYVILGFWWIFITLIMALYASSLAAFLTVSLSNAPLKNLEELASQTHYKPLVLQGTSLFHLFKTAKGGLHKRIWEMMFDMPKVTTMDEAFTLVKTGKYAFLSDSSEIRFELQDKCDELEIAQESFLLTQLSFVVGKNFPFKDAFDNQ